jgi:cell division initiation protein
MSLTPEEILGKRFHDAFRGYNHEEVDVFLDEVAVAFEAAFKDLQAARARIEELEGQVLELKGTEGMLKRTLLAAQRAADETMAEAKTEAARLISAADEEAAAAVASAKQQADDIVASARSRQSRVEEVTSRLRGLQATHLATLRAHLEEQLRALDALPALPEPEQAPGPSADADAAPAAVPGPEPTSEPEAGQTESAEPPADTAEPPADTAEPPAVPELPPPAESPPPDAPEASAAAPRRVSSFSPLAPPAGAEPGTEPGTGGEKPPSRRVPRGPLRPGGPTGGSGESGESSARVAFWGKD